MVAEQEPPVELTPMKACKPVAVVFVFTWRQTGMSLRIITQPQQPMTRGHLAAADVGWLL